MNTENILDHCMKEKAGFVKLLRRMVQLETPPANRKSHQKLFALLLLIPDLNGKSTAEFPDRSELVGNSFSVKQ